MTTNRSVVNWPTGLTLHKPGKCFPGFTVFHIDGNTYMLNMEGEIAHLWAGTSPDLKYIPESQRLLAGIGGKSAISLIRNFTAAACASTVAELNWEGDIAWRLDLKGRSNNQAPALERGWRAEVVGRKLDGLLSGEVAVQVVDPLAEAPLMRASDEKRPGSG